MQHAHNQPNAEGPDRQLTVEPLASGLYKKSAAAYDLLGSSVTASPST